MHLTLIWMGENSTHHPTYSAIPDNDDKVLISHTSNIFTRDQVSNPTRSVKNLSVSKKVALLHMRRAGSWNASDLRDGNNAFSVAWPVTCNSATLWRHSDTVLFSSQPVESKHASYVLVHRSCSAGSKFRLMTIKLLPQIKADRAKTFPPFLMLLMIVIITFYDYQLI